MTERREYELSDSQYQRIMKASQPVPAMSLSGGVPMFGTPQSNANAAWCTIAAELGVDWTTIEPVEGKSDRHISAVPLSD